MAIKLTDNGNAAKLKSDLLHLAHNYVTSYQPTAKDLKNFRVLKDLKKNKNVVILKPDKGNSVVVRDRSVYDSSIFNIINTV